eukprot:m.11224 g.11224  ORF g.11224 m.11224 type:complete len:437 (+) comp6339_c0_seq1:13-1323(+)
MSLFPLVTASARVMALRLLSRVGVRAARTSPVLTQVRCLNLHEYQSKGLMQDYKINVQKFKTADTWEEAQKFAKDLNVEEIVLKAQIHAGGRGKGSFSSGLKGGVQLSKKPEDIGAFAKQMLGYKLQTKQTTGDGVLVNKVMVAEALDIARETYFAILMDRGSNGPVMVGSPAGGVDIEEVAEKTPNLIKKIPVDITKGITTEQAQQMASFLEFKGDKKDEAVKQILRLYDLFLGVDATQIEINPFGETPDGRVVCFDAKINFDDNAAFRQKQVFEMRDIAEEDPREVEASKHNLNYIGMDGNIACLVNGAGLAMATMDIIKLHGGEPANFLDCGGGVNKQMVTQAFKILSADPRVQAICVNIFGGIVDCNTIAGGIVAACKEIGLKLPLVVRLAGTNYEEALKTLEESKLPIQTSNSMDEVAEKAVKAANAALNK